MYFDQQRYATCTHKPLTNVSVEPTTRSEIDLRNGQVGCVRQRKRSPSIANPAHTNRGRGQAVDIHIAIELDIASHPYPVWLSQMSKWCTLIAKNRRGIANLSAIIFFVTCTSLRIHGHVVQSAWPRVGYQPVYFSTAREWLHSTSGFGASRTANWP